MSLSICKQIANLIQLIFSLLLAKNLKCVESPIFNVLNYGFKLINFEIKYSCQF